MIIGVVAAVIIVLAGAGVGLWLGLRGGDGTSSSGAGNTATTVADSNTVQTVPGLGTDTTGPGTGGTTGATDTAPDQLAAWAAASGALVTGLEADDTRIPELADQINSTAPNVPQSVYDELAAMGASLDVLRSALASTPPPPAMEDPDIWLLQATVHMANRIQATMDGIQAMWDSGSVASATDDFNTGRAERDAYRDAMDEYHALMPGD